jgi:hypothetical protein
LPFEVDFLAPPDLDGVDLLADDAFLAAIEPFFSWWDMVRNPPA